MSLKFVFLSRKTFCRKTWDVKKKKKCLVWRFRKWKSSKNLAIFFCNQAIASLKFDISLQLNKCRCKWCDRIFKMFHFKTFFSISVRYKLNKSSFMIRIIETIATIIFWDVGKVLNKPKSLQNFNVYDSTLNQTALSL
jgi:hypothetical protein